MTQATNPALPALAKSAEPQNAARPVTKTKRAKRFMQLAIALVAAASGAAYWSGRGKVVTDDAQVEAHVASVASRVAGQVKRVAVVDNQPVKAGDVLVELDDGDFAARVAAARADLAAANASLDAAQIQLTITDSSIDTGVAAASAEVAAAEARLTLARSDWKRSESLGAASAISPADVDRSRAAANQAAAQLAVAQARLKSMRTPMRAKADPASSGASRATTAQVEAARAQVELAEAHVQQAQAAVEQATLNASYTTLRALLPGVVARRSVEIGQLAAPERPLLAIVSLDDAWVVANFKEDQIASISAGQKARVTIDAFPGRPLEGWVDSIAGGTGSRFSLLPPDNASGNFTKVVQRVPVLIKLVDHPDVALRPGMSAVVTVLTR